MVNWFEPASAGVLGVLAAAMFATISADEHERPVKALVYAMQTGDRVELERYLAADIGSALEMAA